MKLFFPLILIFILPAFIVGQNTIQPKQIDLDLRGIIYRKELAFDLRLHTNGFAFAINSGNIRTYDKTNYLHLEFGYMKDRREKSQSKSISVGSFGQSNSFTFGKINHMFVLRGGWGHRRYLSEKAKRKGLAIGYTYQAGPAIAILKPYYLELQYKQDIDGKIVTDIRNERYTEDNADKFLNYEDIYGGGGFFNGFSELSFTPGIQGKGAVFFSLGAFDEYVKTIEAGIMAEIYAKKIAIMAETPNVSNKPYFVNLYINLQLGKRSN